METKNIIVDGIIGEIQGDAHIGDNTYKNTYNYSERKNKAQFEILSINERVFSDYPIPLFATEIAERAKKSHVMLVGGNYSFNKGIFLKYIAHKSQAKDQQIKELTNYHTFYGISSAIQEETRSSIFLLNYLSPRELNLDLKVLRRIAQSNDHIILISTEDNANTWQFDQDTLAANCFEIPDNELYSKDVLLNHLERVLQKNGIAFNHDKQKVVGNFQTTDQVDYFVEALTKIKEDLTDEEVNKVLAASSAIDFSSIDKWFNGLNQKDKLIVIGLALLDGVFERQFFAAFERLLTAGWKTRSNGLTAIDYNDVSSLLTFFTIDDKTIRCKYRHQRSRLLALAWRTHRRLIVSALPFLSELVIESQDLSVRDGDIFITDQYCAKIRDVISESFSEIGLLSFEELEQVMLQLAAHSGLHSQIVVAKAISRWKLSGDEHIYKVLERWQSFAQVRAWMRFYTRQSADAVLDGSFSYLQATIILTLYYTAAYETNNVLPEKIIQLLRRFIRSADPLIIERLQYVLEGMLVMHPTAMAKLARSEFLLFSHFIDAVSLGLAGAYNNGLQIEVKKILEEWMEYCANNVVQPYDFKKFVHTDRILSAVILTLRNIDYTDNTGAISLQYAHNILEKYRKSEHNKIIRELLLLTIIDLIEVNFHLTESISINFVSNIDRNELSYISGVFKDKYLKQREYLEGGNYKIKLDGRVFETWINQAERPETAVERLLHEWKKSDQHALSQLAFQCFTEIDRSEVREGQLLNEYLKGKEKKPEDVKPIEPIPLPEYKSDLPLNEESAVFLKLCNPFINEEQKKVLRNDAIWVLQGKISPEEAEKSLARINDRSGRDDLAIKNVLFIYWLFRPVKKPSASNPLQGTLASQIFVSLSLLLAHVEKKDVLRSLAPFLMATPDLTGGDIRLLLRLVSARTKRLIVFYYLTKHPQVYVPIFIGSIIIIIIFIKSLLNKIS